MLALYTILTAVVISVPWLMARRWRREDPGDEPDRVLASGPPPEMAGDQELR